MELKIDNANVKTAAGIMLRIPARFRDMGLTARDLLLSAVMEMIMGGGAMPKAGTPFLSVTMPCGSTVEYETAKDLPDGTVMCPCGDKGHKIIDFEWISEILGTS